MQHHFDVDIAGKVGIIPAILLNNFEFWIKKNEANKVNFHDGCYWTYNTVSAMKELFPYLTARQIDTNLKKLIDNGYMKTGNYNASAYDRTLWYAFTEKGESLLHNSEIHFTEMSNGNDENVKPIPDINTDNKPSKFIKPTIEDVRSYCEEKHYSVNPEQWYNYYESNGWKVGRASMKSWKASVTYWETNNKKRFNNNEAKAVKENNNDDWEF